MLRAYYELAKPGIIYGNLLPTVGAYLYASRGVIDWQHFAFTVFGLAFVIASACMINNYADRDMDAKMERTKHRALASGAIPGYKALVFAALLGLAGASLLYNLAHPLAFVAAFVGWLVYVALYTPLKPRTAYALFVGAVAGATPPVVGYTAVVGVFDYTALLLFAALFVWQIPHFLAISIFRYDEYAAAGVPLFIKAPPSDKQRRGAKALFWYTLVILLIFSISLAISGVV